MTPPSAPCRCETPSPAAGLCPACGRRLTAAPSRGRHRTGWAIALALAAVVTTGAAMLVHGFLKERRHWLE